MPTLPRRAAKGYVKPIRTTSPGPATIYSRMGEILSIAVHSEADVVQAVTKGIDLKPLIVRMKDLGVDIHLIAPESTIRRRLQDNQRLNTDESERAVRLARVKAHAVELFGDEESAQAWLTTPAPYLEGSESISPYALSVTDAGARLVESLMLKTAHGIF